MRLAEFKMRLLVFFAGALRKWAGSIEPPRDEVREDRIDDRAAVVPTESRREAGASGPPEHWVRLVATAPPDHWLDLIREKAPHLLPTYENESASATTEEIPVDGPLGGPVNTRADGATGAYASRDSEMADRATPKPRSRRRTQRAADSGPQVSGAKWLSRLRFRPPKQRPVAAQVKPPVYPAADETNKTAEYGTFLHNSSRAAARHESPLTLSDGYDQSREPAPEQQSDRNAAAFRSARDAGSSGNEANEFADRRRQLGTGIAAKESENTKGGAATQERRRQYEYSHEYGLSLTSSKARPEQTARETINDPRQPRASSVGPNIFVERSATKSTIALSRSAADSSRETASPSRRPPSGESELELTGEVANSQDANFVEPRDEARFSSRILRQINAEHPATGANRHASESERKTSLDHDAPLRNAPRVATERSRAAAIAMITNARVAAQSRSAGAVPKKAASNAATRDVEHPRHRFASTDFATPALVESNESMWPTLPPSRNFEMTDELAALEREAETLRRLDREQRGILWNA